MKAPHIPLFLLLAFSIIPLAGCARDQLEAAPSATPEIILTSTPTEEPEKFKPSNCGTALPEGIQVTCGEITVPEDRSQPDSPMITLRFAIIHSQSPDPAPDPILLLNGGPGDNSVEAPFYWLRLFASALAKRDVIVLDQRGTGFSRPALACPEIQEWFYNTLDENLTNEEANQLGKETLKACRDRLIKEGVNLAAYTSAENAADINDLRNALEIPEWNIYGISYGTRLALTVLRDFPNGVRSVILDSAYPPQADLYKDMPVNAERAFDVFFENCAADEKCSQAYPELEQGFFDLVEKIETEPLSLQVKHPLTGKVYPLLENKDRFFNHIFGLMYVTDFISNLPRIIYDLRDGRTDEFAALVGSLIFSADSTNTGMLYSVMCSDEEPFTTSEAILAAGKEIDPRLHDTYVSDDIISTCDEWISSPADPVENLPVTSEVPTLILAGENDPITPPEWGKLAGETLPNSFFVEFPGMGHGILGQGLNTFECTYDIVDAFLADPASMPDLSCVSKIKPYFVTK